MKILVVGSGAREHAIVWKLNESYGVEAQVLEHGNATAAAEAVIATKKSFRAAGEESGERAIPHHPRPIAEFTLRNEGLRETNKRPYH